MRQRPAPVARVPTHQDAAVSPVPVPRLQRVESGGALRTGVCEREGGGVNWSAMTGANVFEVEVGEFDQLVILSPSAVTEDEVARIREAWAEAREKNEPVVMAGFQ